MLYKTLFLAFFISFGLLSQQSLSKSLSAINTDTDCVKIEERLLEGKSSRKNLSQGELEELIDQLETFSRDSKSGSYPEKPCRAGKYKSLLSERKTCEAEKKKTDEALSEFSTACGEFSSGNFRCFKAIRACALCPNEENQEAHDYDCVRIHEKTQCPALSGEELKKAKDKRDKHEEELKDLEEEIQDQQKEIVDKENELNKQLAELEESFSEAVRELERQSEEQKAEVEHQLQEKKTKISAAFNTAVATVQQEIDDSLKVAHSFENAIMKANKQYRAERRQISLECQAQAKAFVAKHRQKRRAAIQSGSLKLSLRDLLKPGRANFAKQDHLRFKKYFATCRRQRLPDYRLIEEALKEQLRLIDQQKEQYQQRLTKLQNQIAALHSQAGEQENQAVQAYSSNMQKILEAYQKELAIVQEKQNLAKKSLLEQTKAIDLEKNQLLVKQNRFMETQDFLVREQELISYLDHKGTEEDSRDKFSKASGALVSYKDAYNSALYSCGCEKDNSSSICKNLKQGAINAITEKEEQHELAEEYFNEGHR